MILTPAQYCGQQTSHIEWLSEQHGLMPEALQAWQAMIAAADRDGLGLNLVSSFRSFDRQLAIWNAKWRGLRDVLDDDNQALDLSKASDLDKAVAILRFSALPGASRHHWGTDLDVYSKRLQQEPLQLIASEYQAGGPQAEVSVWLEERAREFDFYRPYSEDLGGVAVEPWHLSFAPLACKIEQDVQLSEVANCIRCSDMGGKQTLLSHLDELFERFACRVTQPEV